MTYSIKENNFYNKYKDIIENIDTPKSFVDLCILADDNGEFDGISAIRVIYDAMYKKFGSSAFEMEAIVNPCEAYDDYVSSISIYPSMFSLDDLLDMSEEFRDAIHAFDIVTGLSDYGLHSWMDMSADDIEDFLYDIEDDSSLQTALYIKHINDKNINWNTNPRQGFEKEFINILRHCRKYTFGDWDIRYLEESK